MSADSVLNEVFAERQRQHALWGQQDLPDGTGGEWRRHFEKAAKTDCERAVANGTLSYGLIAAEEFAEVMAAGDKKQLRAELVQLAAVCVAWCEKLDREGSL